MATRLLARMLERNPNLKKPDLQKWARDVDLMIRRDNRAPEQIRELIEWCQADEFWALNIRSTRKLRDQFDQLLERSRAASAKRFGPKGLDVTGRKLPISYAGDEGPSPSAVDFGQRTAADVLAKLGQSKTTTAEEVPS